MKKPRDLTGYRNKGSRLTAIKQVKIEPKLGAVWLCDCDCGQKKKAYAYLLIANKIRSCGCIRKEQIQDAAKKITAWGETKTVTQWLKDPRCSISERQLRHRLRTGWNEEEAISRKPHPGLRRVSERVLTAFGETKPISDWLKDPRCTVTESRLKERLRNGWGEEEAISRVLQHGLRATSGSWRKKKSIPLGELVMMAKQQKVSA
jgi:hypothetical protein